MRLERSAGQNSNEGHPQTAPSKVYAGAEKAVKPRDKAKD